MRLSGALSITLDDLLAGVTWTSGEIEFEVEADYEVEFDFDLAPEDEKELVGPDSYNGYVRLKRFPGWKCTSGASAGGCRKGRKIAAYNFFYP